MTDHIHSITVVLEDNVRVDDAEALLSAIGQFRGVISVDGNVAHIGSHVAETRARSKLQQALFEVVTKTL